MELLAPHEPLAPHDGLLGPQEGRGGAPRPLHWLLLLGGILVAVSRPSFITAVLDNIE